jgi:cellulose 1,4-beta-cellobiosidase
MLISPLLVTACAAALVSATSLADYNPFIGRNYYANSIYAGELNQTIAAFLAQNDSLNAARTRTVQGIGTFLWISSVSDVPDIAKAISEARAEQLRTGRPQIVELVVYDLPDRDCAGGQSGGEFSLAKNGLHLYKHEYIDAFAAALAKAPDLTFALVIEPDSLGNVVTNQNIPYCANATAGYEHGIAYAIAKFQMPHVALYLDAAHGGWLGWDSNLPLGEETLSTIY